MFNNLILSVTIASTLAVFNSVNGATNPKTTETIISNNKEVQINEQNDKYIYVADVALYKGKIEKITKTKDGISILVNKGDTDNRLPESLIFHINENTKLNIDEKNLKIGDNLDIFYSGAVTRSLPGQATAIAINVTKPIKEEYLYEGEIKKVIDSKFGTMISVVSKNKDSNFEEIIFNINSNTKLKNGSSSDLKIGSKIKVVYGPVMTMSLPPQTSALSVEVLK